ncbi:hypothetical protein TWF106_008330 [Orbilia oligospora]|uniref:Actin-like ATPase domain-containing protein n=1 Tax=Orbilia oligospora TaxID=2813651 RepID=A0A6G1MHC1_ORBOL|nr:hypothetical protein TWF106_008330 [Orbilia oligospora]KAF3257638.1 hypothetical protein TWF192_000928 [Orbilia oligospora]
MERERLIVAIDFGTTYSGAAFCHSTQDGLRDSEVVSTWANNGVAPKTPTEIRYFADGKESLWGAEASIPCERRQAKDTAPVYSRFKLLLDPTIYGGVYAGRSKPWSLLRRLEDLRLEDSASIKLPSGKTAIDVSSDYLKLLYNDLMNNRLRKRYPDTLDITPIEFVFTIPAIWSHKAQEATRYAAKTAGFSSRPSDSLSLVSEPEAAAMFVLQAMREKNFSRISGQKTTLKRGENFVICDCGGGTVDLISYEVEEEYPKFSLKESVVGTGAKCGSSYIDAAFKSFLLEKLGLHCKDKDWFQKLVEGGSTLMKTFDSIKRSFGQTTNDIWFLELGTEVPDDEEAGIVDSELEFTAKDLQALFDPVVDNVIQLIKDQVKVIQSKHSSEIAPTIFLVGGFGESQYLYKRLAEWAANQTPSLIVVNPTESWSAIMRGAIIQTLKPAVRSRRLRQHYGFRCNIPFNPAKHDITDAYECPFGGWYLRNSGDECDNEKTIDFPVYRVISGSRDPIMSNMIPLFGCKSSKRPIFYREHDVYTLGIVFADFPAVDVAKLPSTTVLDNFGNEKQRYKMDFMVKMKIGSADAIFSIWLNGECLGRTRISHDDEDDYESGLVPSQLGSWLET